MSIAIIGTAGRDKTKPMTVALWQWMLNDARSRIPKGSHVVSGGAAWADHIAVIMYLCGHAGGVTLHLPAPFVNGKFVDSGFKSAGGAANYYHRLFSETIQRDTLGQIAELIARSWASGVADIHIGCEPPGPGIGGMFARNAKVALADEMLAYTFGEGNQPADGGTADTWKKHQGPKTHVPLPILI